MSAYDLMAGARTSGGGRLLPRQSQTSDDGESENSWADAIPPLIVHHASSPKIFSLLISSLLIFQISMKQGGKNKQQISSGPVTLRRLGVELDQSIPNLNFP